MNIKKCRLKKRVYSGDAGEGEQLTIEVENISSPVKALIPYNLGPPSGASPVRGWSAANEIMSTEGLTPKLRSPTANFKLDAPQRRVL